MTLPQFNKFKYYKSRMMKNTIKSLSFSDERKHIVYRITTPKGLHYYGSRTSNTIDIGIKYFTSSSITEFVKDYKNNPQNYKTKVIKEFDNPWDKILFESFLHEKFNVKNNPKFLNKSNQTPSGFDTTGISSWNKGLAKPKQPLKGRFKRCPFCKINF